MKLNRFDQPEPVPHDEIVRTSAFLTMMADIGEGAFARSLVPITREFCGLPPLDSATLNWLFGPIIVHDLHGWGTADGAPLRRTDIQNLIYKQRIEVGMGISPFLVGPAEWMTVAYDRAVGQAPSDLAFHDVWMWAAGDTMAKISGQITMDSFWDGLARSGTTRLVQDDILTNPRYSECYNGLAREIISKCANHRTKKLRSA